MCPGVAPSPEVNNKMNNKVDGTVTPKPEPKSKVTWSTCTCFNNTSNVFFLVDLQSFHSILK